MNQQFGIEVAEVPARSHRPPRRGHPIYTPPRNCIYIYVYVCVCPHGEPQRMHVSNISTHRCQHTYKHVCMCTFEQAHPICIHISVYKHTHTHMYIYIYTFTHTPTSYSTCSTLVKENHSTSHTPGRAHTPHNNTIHTGKATAPP